MLRERAASAAILVPVLLVALALGNPFIAIAVGLATFVAALEVFALLRAAGYPSLPALGTVFAVVLLADAIAPDRFAAGGLLLASIGIALVAVGAFSRGDPREGFTTWMATVFGAVYVAQLGFVVRLGAIAPPLPAGARLEALGAERAWILLLVLGVWAYDTGAYFVGRRFGRARFLEHISPSKTYAGLLGGLSAATVVVTIVLWGIGRPPLEGLVLGPLVGLAAQAGDLAESMLKRAAGARDSGTLIPGHGGMLDRIDSFLVAAPVVTLYVVAVVA
ncbi:MAG TPA: phosphatidate cytidylyltransferase [Candidatus Limnocylindrales bacterium]